MHTAGPSIWRGLTSAQAEVFRKYSWRGQHSLVSVEHKAQQCGSLASAQVAQGLACTANSTVGFGSEGLLHGMAGPGEHKPKRHRMYSAKKGPQHAIVGTEVAGVCVDTTKRSPAGCMLLALGQVQELCVLSRHPISRTLGSPLTPPC